MTSSYDPALYGNIWADVYDSWHASLDPTPIVDFLAGLADNGRILELAIGTGRVALPLVARGIKVEGIEASLAMVSHLQAKPGGHTVPVTIGDMAEVGVTGPFQMAYLIFNTIFGLLEREQQANCFRNVALALEPGGVFVLECFSPSQASFYQDEITHKFEVTENSVHLAVTHHDPARQRVTIQTIIFNNGGLRILPETFRYCWPDELDLMAEQAGLRLRERYADWNRRPFNSTSSAHISVYERFRPALPPAVRLLDTA